MFRSGKAFKSVAAVRLLLPGDVVEPGILPPGAHDRLEVALDLGSDVLVHELELGFVDHGAGGVNGSERLRAIRSPSGSKSSILATYEPFADGG